MKGIVFTEFMEMVEVTFSEDTLDEIIEMANPPSGASYTAVGTYDHAELVAMVSALHQHTDIPIPDLIHTFGHWLFKKFAEGFPAFFERTDNAFDFLRSIEDVIHVEVRKLYPDAELPSFDYETIRDDELLMVYRSNRHFADLAAGLIQGCVEHFNEQIRVERNDLDAGAGAHVEFTLTKAA